MRKLSLGLLIIALFAALTLSPALAETRIKLATTTSTENTGLLAYILPFFEKQFGMKVDVIAVGTGKAIKHGENGDVDVLLVHDRKAEEKFVKEGFGVNRRGIMYNDFIILGPKGNPAKIGGKDVSAALKTIEKNALVFVSRGDESGTHAKEKVLWAAAGIKPQGKWYLEAGQGMAQVLQMADEKNGYTLSDRGTFIALEDKLRLSIIVEGDARLNNPYSVIAVSPYSHKGTNYSGAMNFITWLTSPETQELIAGFKKNGKAMFFPSASQEE